MKYIILFNLTKLRIDRAILFSYSLNAVKEYGLFGKIYI